MAIFSKAYLHLCVEVGLGTVDCLQLAVLVSYNWPTLYEAYVCSIFLLDTTVCP